MNHRLTTTGLAAAAAAGLFLAGCGSPSSTTAESAPPPTSDGQEMATLVQQGLPSQTTHVAAAKMDARSGDNIVLVGRVKDFVEGASVLTLADESLEDCKRGGHACTTPWDYCCLPPDIVSSGTATVKLLNSDGAPWAAGLQGVKNIDHLVQLAAEGKAVRDDAGNLVVEAKRLYVKP